MSAIVRTVRTRTVKNINAQGETVTETVVTEELNAAGEVLSQVAGQPHQQVAAGDLHPQKDDLRTGLADFERRFQELRKRKEEERSIGAASGDLVLSAGEKAGEDADEESGKELTKTDSDSELEDGEESKFGSYVLKNLELHNELRAKHGVLPLKLSKQMCDYAQEWAEKLCRENKFQHRSSRKYGENIYQSWSSSATKPDPKKPVQSWYDEVKNYSYGQGGFSGNTGHFTQVVWKESRELGVGMATNQGKVVVVANYNPPGNFQGRYEENVLPPVK